jgi:SAM-dependent methyltransferase
VLATARRRAASRGLAWARFVEGNVASVPLSSLATQRFDAVVGRLVLMYQPDPTAVLHHLATLVKPDGVVAFQEGVVFAPRAWPRRPLYAECFRRLLGTFERSGATMDMGLRLHQVFLDAGLPAPEVHLDGIVVAGSDAHGFRWFADVVRSALPAMERHGIATADEVQIETLVDRLMQEALEAPGAVCGLGLGGAWTRRPAHHRSPLELLAVSDGR